MLCCVRVYVCVYNFLSTVLLFIDFSTFFPPFLVLQTYTFLFAFMAYMCLLLPLFSISHTLPHTFEIIHSVTSLTLSPISLTHTHTFFSFSHLHDTHILFTFHIFAMAMKLAIHAFSSSLSMCLCMLRDTPCFYVHVVSKAMWVFVCVCVFI